MDPIDRCPTCGSQLVADRRAVRTFVIRAVKVALLVGTGLTLINQAGALFGGAPTGALWWKIPMTYTVPFCVSLFSSIAAQPKERRDSPRGGNEPG